MTITDWLMLNMRRLGEAKVDAPRRDCLVLLEDTLNKDRAWVVAHPEHTLQTDTLHKLDKLISRRINREPLAYIRGKAWFYGRFFEVNPHVLIPRPESENFIELLKQLVENRQQTADSRSKLQVIDVGRGSGCLAVTAKLELPHAEVIATDIDEKALEVAQANAKKHRINIILLKGSLLGPISNLKPPTSNLVIIANLPYVPSSLVTSPEIEAEPAGALFSGKDGLDHYRKFWHQVSSLKTKPKYILTESLEQQHKDLEILAKNADYKIAKINLLTQVFTLSR